MDKPLVNLKKDINAFEEWAYRFRFFYGLCRGVLAQSFVNNWINGVLYSFPIQIVVYFDKKNKPLPPSLQLKLYILTQQPIISIIEVPHILVDKQCHF